MNNPRWIGLRPEARAVLVHRDYSDASLATRLAGCGVEAGALLEARESLATSWIPGVEIFSRKVYPQRHRGYFGEFARRDEGKLGEIGLWPCQWATATMFAESAKGFHIHPPHIPEGEGAATWFQKLFSPGADLKMRPYGLEQWDVMFFVHGIAEMFLVDERVGMERRRMRMLLDGDNHRGPNNVAVVIPPGVAHAIRSESSEDLVMVYGTSTVFDPENEGRIGSAVEIANLPREWEDYLRDSSATASR